MLGPDVSVAKVTMKGVCFSKQQNNPTHSFHIDLYITACVFFLCKLKINHVKEFMNVRLFFELSTDATIMYSLIQQFTSNLNLAYSLCLCACRSNVYLI